MPARHLAFSGGRHLCLGAALARTEGEAGLRRFFTHFPDAQLAGAGRRRYSGPTGLGRAAGSVGRAGSDLHLIDALGVAAADQISNAVGVFGAPFPSFDEIA